MTVIHVQRLMTLIHAKGLTIKIIHLHVSLGGKKVIEFSERQTLMQIQPCIMYGSIDVVSIVAVAVTTVVC
jgi:hypothetical protein